jgi:hypothetical protein
MSLHQLHHMKLREASNGQLRSPEEISAVPPMDGVTEAMPINHGITSAVSPEADRSQKADVYVMNSEKSAAYTRSELKTGT